MRLAHFTKKETEDLIKTKNINTLQEYIAIVPLGWSHTPSSGFNNSELLDHTARKPNLGKRNSRSCLGDELR